MRDRPGGLFVAALAACGIAALGAPAMGAEPAAKAAAGQASVGAAAFSDDTGDPHCRVAKGFYAYVAADPEATDVDCDLVAGIQLPDGVQLRSLRCGLYDSQASNVLQAHLVRVELASGEPQVVFTTAGTVDSGLVQMVGDAAPAPGTADVDNAKFAYYLAAAFSYTDFSATGNELRVYGCTVSYK